MGLPMARRVIAGGYELLTAVHVRREPADELAALGARVLADPAAVAAECDVVITIVPADSQLAETALGDRGLIHGFSAGKVLIDMTTATPMAIQAVEERMRAIGVEVLDAPVSGGTTAAANGTLTIMTGGDARLLERCRPLLQTMGTTIIHAGPLGQGKVVKMVNQLMAAIHLLAIGEAFALGQRCGADPNVLYDTIKASSGYSRMMDLRLPGFLLNGSFAPGFKLDLMKKDVNLASESARALGIQLSLGGMAAELFAAASAAGHGAEDFSAAAEYVARLAQATLAQPDTQDAKA
jgi:3-hydroxyisobutyrate dehydrogenase-like beta-hydroxyacid dehydrogenase